jgi:hypothetical protein
MNAVEIQKECRRFCAKAFGILQEGLWNFARRPFRKYSKGIRQFLVLLAPVLLSPCKGIYFIRYLVLFPFGKIQDWRENYVFCAKRRSLRNKINIFCPYTLLIYKIALSLQTISV